jgi:hypothetical protein
MLRFCPRGEENSVFFNCLFLQKLPRELRILLSEADIADKRLLSKRADQFWAHNAQLWHDTVATVAVDPEEADGAVAAVFPSRGGQSGRRGGRQSIYFSWVTKLVNFISKLVFELVYNIHLNSRFSLARVMCNI